MTLVMAAALLPWWLYLRHMRKIHQQMDHPNYPTFKRGWFWNPREVINAGLLIIVPVIVVPLTYIALTPPNVVNARGDVDPYLVGYRDERWFIPIVCIAVVVAGIIMWMIARSIWCSNPPRAQIVTLGMLGGILLLSWLRSRHAVRESGRRERSNDEAYHDMWGQQGQQALAQIAKSQQAAVDRALARYRA